MQINWPPEHCDVLRDCLAKGMSFAEAADAINARFGAAYSRNATIGRTRRMGLAALDRPKRLSKVPQESKPPRSRKNPRSQKNNQRAAEPTSATPAAERPHRVKLRCVQIVPRHLPLIELEAGDCRYPYGGDADGEAITFCGHPQREGSSYCLGHFNLTRGPGTPSERAAIPVALRLVAAA